MWKVIPDQKLPGIMYWHIFPAIVPQTTLQVWNNIKTCHVKQSPWYQPSLFLRLIVFRIDLSSIQFFSLSFPKAEFSNPAYLQEVFLTLDF